MQQVLENFEAWLPWFALFPGSEMRQIAGVTAWTSDVPVPFFNGAYGITETTVDDVLPFLEGRPVLWVVPPPGGIEADLAERGFELAEIPGMAIELAQLPPTVVPDGVEVRPVDDDPELLATATNIAFTTNGFPAEVTRPMLEMLDRIPNRKQFRTFLATVDGAPAAASALLVTDDTAGLYNVGTLPEFRRRGLGRLVSLAALEAGSAAGCSIGVLDASPDGEPVYLGLGFEEVCRFTFAIRA
ncbi:MAG: GNAT family N-acetyltransferase [Gaiellaceae bacterium]